MSKVGLGIGALLAAVVCSSISVEPAKATQIMVGQCVEFGTCWTAGASWSDTLSAAQLGQLGLGATEPEVATQTSEYVIRLGVTSFDFATTGGPVDETIGEYNGPGVYFDPGPFPVGQTVGTFAIPADATGLTYRERLEIAWYRPQRA